VDYFGNVQRNMLEMFSVDMLEMFSMDTLNWVKEKRFKEHLTQNFTPIKLVEKRREGLPFIESVTIYL
jgi:hypothetical protein